MRSVTSGFFDVYLEDFIILGAQQGCYRGTGRIHFEGA